MSAPPGHLKHAAMAVMARRPFRQFLCWRVSTNGRRIALTFDDGPHPEFTLQVLDILSRHRIPATFYVLGAAVEKHPDLLRRALADGHEIGLHGYDHTQEDLPDQMERTSRIVRELGAPPLTVRPPGGRLSAGVLGWAVTRRLPLVLWSFDLEDSRRHEGKAASRRPFDEIDSGDVVLMHDDNPVCVEELPELLENVRQRGLQPARMSELLAGSWASLTRL